MTKHAHWISEECTERCPAFDLNGWACNGCGRQVPMLAETEDWPLPLCGDCFDGIYRKTHESRNRPAARTREIADEGGGT